MTLEQIALFLLFATVFAFMVWGRIRYDLVAFAALVLAAFTGLVDPDQAFMGFGHSAVVIIAFVLIISRGLTNSGAVELIAGYLLSAPRQLQVHIGIMSLAGAALSAVINNVAALALLMPLDLEAAKKAKRLASQSLMPLSFATLLGGMITLIGTPPNIVVSQYRERAVGQAFSMFDFTPVGLTVALAGIVFVALVGWRLVPLRERASPTLGEQTAGLFVAEAQVRADSKVIGQEVGSLDALAAEHDILILGLVRRGKRLPGFSRHETIRKSDFLVLEGSPTAIEAFVAAAQLEYVGADKHGGVTGKSLTLAEVIVPDGARIAGRSAMDLRLLYRHGVTLLGVSRQGRQFRERVRKLVIHPGDVLLLLGPKERLSEVIAWLGVLALADRDRPVIQREKAAVAIALFATAIALSVAGITPLIIALGACVVGYVGLGIVNGREAYEAIDWKIIVLLASLIPLGVALEESGGTRLIAETIVAQTRGWPAWSVLAVLMIVTMTLSDFLNNVATALIAAPIGMAVAQSMGAAPDAFLMGVAVASSCAFLTPIGHKNNTIIMGPGAYHFGDYWRLGLPLELLVLAVSIPALLIVWPL